MAKKNPMLCPRKHPDGPGYYLYEDLEKMFTKPQLKKFDGWIYGQTCYLLPTGKPGYYSEDVHRFRDRVLKNLPTYFD